MSNVNFLYLSIWEISQELQKGSVTSQKLVSQCFEMIKTYNKSLGAFLNLDKEGAQAAAKASDNRIASGKTLGPLDGVPVGLKDMILTKDMQSTAASKILEGFIPPYEATVSLNLKKNGAVILGKLNQDEFAMGSSNEMSAYAPCRNPWDLQRSPGGSSGGSAVAVAAPLCFGALGTDTGGSIRQPAAFCGVVGIKPTYGRVSRFGVIAYASSLDQVGPLTKDVQSAALMLQAIAGHDERDSTSVDREVPDYASTLQEDITGFKVGIPKEYFAHGLDKSVEQASQNAIDALKKRGAIIEKISLPHTKYAVPTYYIVSSAEASSNLSRYDGIRFGPRKGKSEGLEALYCQTRGELFGTEVKRRIMLGTYVLSAGYYDTYYLRAQKIRRLFASDFAKVFEKVDMILAPTSPTSAFKIGEKVDDPLKMYLNDVFTISANLAGLPGISLNTGFCENGMPIGTQIIGKPFCEAQILNAAYHVEQELPFNKWPKLRK